MSPLEAVTCSGCGKDACYVRENDIEDIPSPVYCVKCVVIQPKSEVSK